MHGYPMSEIRLTHPSAEPTPGRSRRAVVTAIVAVTVVLVGATLALWAVWGPAVFYEVILAGIAACF